MSKLARLLFTVFVTLAALLKADIAHADSLRGFVQKTGLNRNLLVVNADSSTTSYTLIGSTDDVTDNLTSLHNGDFLVGRGTINGSAIQLDAIESLGLQALVGIWKTAKNEVYEFRDFTRLNLYVPDDVKSEIVKAAELQYTIAPDSGAKYQLFLSNQSQVTLGSLEFRKRQIEITLIDPKTGEVSSDVLLSPLASH